MFSIRGVKEGCGLFGIEHFILITITLIIICILLYFTKNFNHNQVKKVLKISCILLWILEVLKIIFVLQFTPLTSVNEYIPLYFCSMLLYATLLSNLKNKYLKRVGDVFLATGGIIGGLVFLIMPTTSLPYYPAYHFISIHSFFFHGTMIYLGLLLNITGYIKLNIKDIFYYGSLVLVLSILALIINNIFNSNLMFISKDFPGTPIHYIYEISGNLFTPIMIIGQMTLPFLVIYYIIKFINNFRRSH